MKKLLALLALLIMGMTLCSCKMLKGAGEDISDAGNAVKDATN